MKNNQQSIVIWITGLSGSGKTTIGREVYNKFKNIQANTVFLDGDSFREILGNDLGYEPSDRLENAKRISRMCIFLASQNINVICSTMSLYKEIHNINRAKIDNYIEVLIDCDIDELIRRDQKGLYSKTVNNPDEQVIGMNLTYDKPTLCELTIDNNQQDKLQEKANKILELVFPM